MYSCTTPVKDSKTNKFYVGCGNAVFQRFRPKFEIENDEYLNYIKEINDPILRHISLYFVQHYIDGYNYYHNSELDEINGACYYLNRWLEERKDLFTYGEQCPTKKESWDNAINTLWGMLKNEYTTSKKNGKPWCDKYPIKLTTTYPRELTSLSCDETITPESKSADPSPQPVETNCKCPPSEVPVIPLLPVQAPEADRTKNIAVTSGFTAAGTLGTLFFLYRFTPMMSWFRRPGMNNVGTDLYMNPGGAESFISMQQGNGSNNLFYQP